MKSGRDRDGSPSTPNGGGVLFHEGTYYHWYGEFKTGKPSTGFQQALGRHARRYHGGFCVTSKICTSGRTKHDRAARNQRGSSKGICIPPR